ncbi:MULTISPECIES: hypothetical protein [unclassified Streptomyces]|uniref:hypothetical protein n=1 Tax=unclassified Streptomyces TaxID=2593676 RepID=UPI002E379C59|nr:MULTISPECIES: hypothetical protein [unclassified Streptomyces]WUC69217.1 hypothetical protein OG861_33815 [Streptomyces sp. NBC_00539]
MTLALTDPEHNRLGRLATLWIGDYAVRRTPRLCGSAVPSQTKRRLVPSAPVPGGVRTARDTVGYLNFLLQKAAEPIEHLDLLVTTGALPWIQF